MILNKQRLTNKTITTGKPILGMDFGEKTLGYAISDGLLWGASPLVCWQRKKLVKEDFAHCLKLVNQHQAAALIVGWPLRTDGAESEICKAVLNFCRRLEPELSIPIILWDERFSSMGAETMLQGQGFRGRKVQDKIDKYAASLILQGFLDYWQANCNYERSL